MLPLKYWSYKYRYKYTYKYRYRYKYIYKHKLCVCRCRVCNTLCIVFILDLNSGVEYHPVTTCPISCMGRIEPGSGDRGAGGEGYGTIPKHTIYTVPYLYIP